MIFDAQSWNRYFQRVKRLGNQGKVEVLQSNLENVPFAAKVDYVVDLIDNDLNTPTMVRIECWESVESVAHIAALTTEKFAVYREYLGGAKAGILFCLLVTPNEGWFHKLLCLHFAHEVQSSPSVNVRVQVLCKLGANMVVDIYDDRGLFIYKRRPRQRKLLLNLP